MWSHVDLIAESPGFSKLLLNAQRAARKPVNVLISGESGTGKECVARFIHDQSPRKRGPFIALNCAAIPESLMESELFGFAKGAFTGAQVGKKGLFEEAQNGTLFLDEIGELSLSLQAKLLRVIQERKLRRLGESQERPLDIRIVAATNQDLKNMTLSGQFREDLYFRLNVIPFCIPALRERREDVIPLAQFFLRQFSEKYKLTCPNLSASAQGYLLNQRWLGNVRELQNFMERALILCEKPWIQASDLAFLGSDEEENSINADDSFFEFSGGLLSLEDLTQKYIRYALQRNNGAKEKTAKDLGIDRKTLYRHLQSFSVKDSSLSSVVSSVAL